ncbi:hypothetical protein EVJ58_g11155, partial [Rhodofomes roseus]
MEDVENADDTLRDLDHIRVPPAVDENTLTKTADINEFFDKAYDRISEKNARTQRVRDCKVCRRRKVNKYGFVSDVSTLRRHLGAHHEDVAARKLEAEKANKVQTSLDNHVQKAIPKEHAAPYSDDLFKSAAIEWLVETDQPIGAFEHPKFINMINVAARAKNGVTIPSRWTTCREIINLFHQYL